MFAAKDLQLTRPSGGYTIPRSLRFRSSAGAYLNRTQGTPTSSQKMTLSFWVKRGKTQGTYTPLYSGSSGSAAGGDQLAIYDGSASEIRFFLNGAASALLNTTQVFRDFSAWYHIVVAIDTTQATAANRVIFYVNGVQITSFSTASYPAQNYNLTQFFANTNVNRIGYDSNTVEYFDGYRADFYGVDGQQLNATSFGAISATTGVWAPIKYTGTYGANGFHLDFNSYATTAALGTDTSGNGNTWTVNNCSVTAGVTYDSMIDVPTVSATGSNYCTLNPIVAAAANITNGNLTSGTTAVQATMDALAFNSYWEVTAGASAPTCGTISGTGTTNTTSVTANKVFGFRLTTAGALDYINITDVGAWTSITTGLTGNQYPYGVTQAANWNFGQRAFTGTVPVTYSALNTFNLPTPSILIGAAHMAATTYTGTGASQTIANTVNSSNFQPDLVWMKGRSGATDHALYDSVRGTTKDIASNTTAAETTQATGLTAFGSTGFTIGALAKINTNAATYVGWQWKGSGTTVSNTTGSITSTVCVNPTAGFSIAGYTGNGTNGATIGHSLGVAPSMVIFFDRTGSNDHAVYHISNGNTGLIRLNLTAASVVSTSFLNSTSPSSSVITLGTLVDVNQSTHTYVAYSFAPIAGYSAFGSYTGNGSADGPFVYCGFRPRWLMIRRTDVANEWVIHDTSRATYNLTELGLYPSAAGAESASGALDILSNGFKQRANYALENTSSGTYIYAAFAESPFKNSLAR